MFFIAAQRLSGRQFHLTALSFSLFSQGFHAEVAVGFELVFMDLDR